MLRQDTIIAISSASGPAARMILRLSGPDAWSIAARCCTPADWTHARFARTSLNIDGMTCPATIYPFQSPRSFTGEDLIELHLPGNPLLVELALRQFLGAGVRHAEPGEFTARAFFHGKLDLAQAEGVAATIAASDQASHRAAQRLLDGEMARRLAPIMDRIAHVLAMTEAQLDFSDEPLEPESFAPLRAQAQSALDDLHRLVADSARLAPLRREPLALLFGLPNAGKSSLLNALAGTERAVVSPIPGVTRDVLQVSIRLRRGSITLADAAGLAPETTEVSDAIDQLTRRATLRALGSADVVALVIDQSDPAPQPPLPRAADVIVLNKSDLPAANVFRPPDAIHVSALSGENLEALREALDRAAFGMAGSSGTLAMSTRALTCIEAAQRWLAEYLQLSECDSADLVLQAAALRGALDELGEVLGAVAPDDILGRIFSTFCIGK